MSLDYADQVQHVRKLVVSNPASAINIVLGWKPRYVRAYNVNNLTSYEYFTGMAAGTSLDDTGAADANSLNAAGAVTIYDGRTAGAAVTGTVTVTAASPTVTGSGTNFVGELAIGDWINVGGQPRKVLSITSTTVLTADAPFITAAAAVQLFDMTGKGPGVTLGLDIVDTAADVVYMLAIR